MSARPPRLPKDVAAIFGDAILPEEVADQCACRRVSLLAMDPRPDACAAVLPGDPEIERLMEWVACRRDYACCRSGEETPCRTRPLLGRVVECLEPRSYCGHRSPLLRKVLCTCAIRHHLLRRQGSQR
jgi:hypothetical protein